MGKCVRTVQVTRSKETHGLGGQEDRQTESSLSRLP